MGLADTSKSKGAHAPSAVQGATTTLFESDRSICGTECSGCGYAEATTSKGDITSRRSYSSPCKEGTPTELASESRRCMDVVIVQPDVSWDRELW